MDALQWMGAVRMGVQTADKNITIIHTTPDHQLMSCEVKGCVLITNKTLKMFLTSNHCFHQKYESSIHNIAFSSEKAVSSELGEKYAQIKHCLHAKTVVNKYVCVLWCERTTGDVLFHWRKHHYGSWTCILARRDILKLKCLDEFVSYKHTAFRIKNAVVWITCGVLWCFYQLFGLSFWRHPFTAEDPLVSNISPNLFWWRNKLIYNLDALRMSKFSSWVNYFFNVMHYTCVNSEELT